MVDTIVGFLGHLLSFIHIILTDGSTGMAIVSIIGMIVFIIILVVFGSQGNLLKHGKQQFESLKTNDPFAYKFYNSIIIKTAYMGWFLSIPVLGVYLNYKDWETGSILWLLIGIACSFLFIIYIIEKSLRYIYKDDELDTESSIVDVNGKPIKKQ